MRRTILIVAAIAVISLVTFGLARLEPAAPSVSKETVWIDTVKRGPMLRQVRGPGTLVPEEVRWISAPVEARVERIPALPGVTVTADTVLLEMSDPEIEQAAVEAESQLRAAQADYEDLKAQLESQTLNQQSQVNGVESQSEQANLQEKADETLAKDGLIPELNLKLSRLRASQLTKQARIERERLQQSKQSSAAQLSSQRARVEQMRAMHQLRLRQLESLKVRAGIPGVLQELPVQVGQSVTPGTVLARVARPERLKAELRIPETQAKDVVRGQAASIDTRNGVIPGHVMRVAPSSVDGTVIVDVAFDGPLPNGARPNLSVDGTVEIERLANVLYVGRPSIGQANSKIELFKVADDGKKARRVPVGLGRTSVNTVEIVSGLQAGDKVILSDTAAQDGYDVINLN
ncbi:MAG TPA: HlyD family efflux transporter periplasmic adaptor subunit [Thermoanaerobaculia bacterium]|nr:HlyD family efflux transporter periplasmic adaptor subunit [Thermoanaerobaculia bacterium]